MQVLNEFRLCSNFVSRFPLIYTDRIFEGIKKKNYSKLHLIALSFEPRNDSETRKINPSAGQL